MHTYIHCRTVYKSKDVEPTHMPITDRLDKENVEFLYHRILCSHKKTRSCVLCRDMGESRNHHSQQTDTRTENQTLNVFTHRRVMNNENTWTQGREQHSTVLGWVVEGRDSQRLGRMGRDNTGRNAGCKWGRGMETANHHGMYVPMQQSCRMQGVYMYPRAQSIIKKKNLKNNTSLRIIPLSSFLPFYIVSKNWP